MPGLKALVGAIYTKQTGSGADTVTSAVTIPNYDDDLWTAYAQVDYQPFSILHLTAGGQAIKVPDNNLQFVPRLAGIFNFTPSLGVKALYSSAYRAPSEAERHLVLYQPNQSNQTVNVGNPDLLPETVGTLDLQVFLVKINFFRDRRLTFTAANFSSSIRSTWPGPRNISISETTPPKAWNTRESEPRGRSVCFRGR